MVSEQRIKSLALTAGKNFQRGVQGAQDPAAATST